MQHDLLQKKNCFDPFTPPVGVEGVCKGKIFVYLYVVIHIISFNLICNMTILCKSIVFAIV